MRLMPHVSQFGPGICVPSRDGNELAEQRHRDINSTVQNLKVLFPAASVLTPET